ncbi:hypothetical protein BJ508DRAFT_381632 [Ascobolus immersus RN42]|uniref:Uncharacterized protein n=1 Tax=Ascobolus immersus RN42 TaxID=1160509 RepID=A0A3N4HFB2_ASCIM|nr:hypothetical protein BJ508DRAFT_381632 [Ascobolus immersus RN42]
MMDGDSANESSSFSVSLGSKFPDLCLAEDDASYALVLKIWWNGEWGLGQREFFIWRGGEWNPGVEAMHVPKMVNASHTPALKILGNKGVEREREGKPCPGLPECRILSVSIRPTRVRGNLVSKAKDAALAEKMSIAIHALVFETSQFHPSHSDEPESSITSIPSHGLLPDKAIATHPPALKNLPFPSDRFGEPELTIARSSRLALALHGKRNPSPSSTLSTIPSTPFRPTRARETLKGGSKLPNKASTDCAEEGYRNPHPSPQLLPILSMGFRRTRALHSLPSIPRTLARDGIRNPSPCSDNSANSPLSFRRTRRPRLREVGRNLLPCLPHQQASHITLSVQFRLGFPPKPAGRLRPIPISDPSPPSLAQEVGGFANEIPVGGN